MTGKQLKAALMLLSGEKQTDIATTLNITPVTIRRWRQNKEFNAFINASLTESSQAAAAKLHDATTQAISTLNELVGKDNPPMVRLGAAKTIVDLLLKLDVLKPYEISKNNVDRRGLSDATVQAIRNAVGIDVDDNPKPPIAPKNI